MHQKDPPDAANLFDASIVFAVGPMAAPTQAFSLPQSFNPASEFTIVTKAARTGQMEFIEKTKREGKVKRAAPERTAGEGTRLGATCQLPDGLAVYVLEGAK